MGECIAEPAEIALPEHVTLLVGQKVCERCNNLQMNHKRDGIPTAKLCKKCVGEIDILPAKVGGLERGCLTN